MAGGKPCTYNCYILTAILNFIFKFTELDSFSIQLTDIMDYMDYLNEDYTLYIIITL